MAVALYDGLPVMISGAGISELYVFDHDLSLFSSRRLPFLAGQSDAVELSPAPIGAAGSLVIGSPAELDYVERGTLRLNPPAVESLSQPASRFTNLLGVGSDAAGRLVIAEPTRVSIGTPPAVAGGAYTWVQRALAGVAWETELVADVTGDGRPDVIGYRKPAGDAELCVHDGADAPAFQPTCKVMPGQRMARAVLLFDDLDPALGRDLIVATVAANGLGRVDAYPDLHTNVGVVSGPLHTLTIPRVPVAMVAIDVDGDHDKELMMIDGQGALRCVALTAAGFGPC